jgi:peptidoglycan-N-acetylglucosamine deacetylase
VLAPLAGVGVAALIWLFPPFGVVRLVARLAPDVTFHVDTDEPLVALSFDDGPHPATTPLVLDALERHGARATFFAVGELAERHPELVRRIAAEGHELGNHTWRVERSASLAPAELEAGIGRTQALLEGVAPVRLMRPGSGWFNRRLLDTVAAHGLRCVLGSIYPQDPWVPSKRFIIRYVTARARPGAIVILHEGTPARARVGEILDAVLPAIAARGLRVTTVSELLEAGR